MTKLYSHLAKTYHEVYQSIFDYKKEFKFYNRILKKYNCKSILEVACGSGNLAPNFLKNGYKYVGLDLSNKMLNIVKSLEPNAKFVQGDMRKLNLNQKFDCILVTGRSFTYMTKNKDVMDALKSFHKNLNTNGILIFDTFMAEKRFANFKKRIVKTAKYGHRKYRRVTINSMNLKDGFTWDIDETYYIKETGKKTKVVKDKDLLRAFTDDELKLFLEINNFDIINIFKDGDIRAIVARKKKERNLRGYHIKASKIA